MSVTSIRYSRTEDIQTFGLALPGLESLTLDFTNVPAEERGGAAKKLLGASVMSCFCSALSAALLARGAVYSFIRGDVSVKTGLDEAGRSRVLGIALVVEVGIAEEDEAILERCVKVMRKGCLVSASLEPGIRISHAIRPVFPE